MFLRGRESMREQRLRTEKVARGLLTSGMPVTVIAQTPSSSLNLQESLT